MPPSRRSVLTAGGLLALAACVPDDAAPAPGREARLRAEAADEIAELRRLYAAVAGRFPAESTDLDPLAAEHEAHRRALVGASTMSSRTTEGSPPPVPVTPVEARASLAVAERAAAGRRRHEALRAGPDLARLLASIAACNETHAVLLDGA